MVGVGQDHRRLRLAELVRRDALDRAGRADRHEDGRFHGAVRCGEHAASGMTVDRDDLECMHEVERVLDRFQLRGGIS